MFVLIFQLFKWKTLILHTFDLKKNHTHKASLYAGNFYKKGYAFTNYPPEQFISKKQIWETWVSMDKRPLKFNLTPLFVRKLPTWDSLGWIQLVNTNTNRHIPVVALSLQCSTTLEKKSFLLFQHTIIWHGFRIPPASFSSFNKTGLLCEDTSQLHNLSMSQAWTRARNPTTWEAGAEGLKI